MGDTFGPDESGRDRRNPHGGIPAAGAWPRQPCARASFPGPGSGSGMTAPDRIEGILFDMDDTLYDFSATWQNGTRELLEDIMRPYAIPPDEYWPTFERLNRVLFRHVDTGQLPGPLARVLRWELLSAIYDLDGLDVESINQRHLRTMAERCVPFPDTVETVRQLAALYRLGIITNGPGDLLAARLKTIGLDRFFPPSRRIAADQVNAYKPDPAIFRIAMRHMGLPATSVIFVGDSWDFDIQGAVTAGMPAVWFNPHGRTCPDPDSLWAEIARLSDLPRLLARRTGGA